MHSPATEVGQKSTAVCSIRSGVCCIGGFCGSFHSQGWISMKANRNRGQSHQTSIAAVFHSVRFKSRRNLVCILVCVAKQQFFYTLGNIATQANAGAPFVLVVSKGVGMTFSSLTFFVSQFGRELHKTPGCILSWLLANNRDGYR